MFFTSNTLVSGAHTFDLEWVNSPGGFTMDFYEVTTSGTPSTTTTAPPTTTTTPPVTTTVPPNSASRVEAESLTPPSACWSRTDYVRFSGGAGRTCIALNAPLSWTVFVGPGQTGAVRLYGYQDSVPRGFRVRVDGGPWTAGSLSGPHENASALFFTSESLNAGTHGIELEWTDSAGAFTLDFYELTTGGATTTTTAPVTTTTTVASTTTTVGQTCNIAPANDAASINRAIAGCRDGTAGAPTVVRFPPNAAYTVTDSVFLNGRSHVTLDLNGSTLRNDYPAVYGSYVPTVKIRLGTNVRIRNGTVAGNFTPPTTDMGGPYAAELRKNNQWNAGVTVAGGEGVYVEDLNINRVFGDAVMVLPSDANMPAGDPGAGTISRNVHVARVKATLHARQCVGLAAADGFWIEDVTCKESWYGGVDVEPDPNVPSHTIHNGHVLRNTFDGFGLYAVAVPYDAPTGQVDGVEIRGNQTLTYGASCGAPIQTVYRGPGEAETPQTTIANIVIEDNRLLAQGDGILVRDVSSGTVKRNHIETNRPPTWCRTSEDPPVPVRLINSPAVVVSENTTPGYPPPPVPPSSP